MSATKMKYNKIEDMNDSTKSITVPASQDSADFYPQINYIQDLEFVGDAKYVSGLGNTINFYNDVATSTAIASPYSWKNDYENFQCASGKILASTGSPRDCGTTANSMTVFVSPGINSLNNSYVDVSIKSITIGSLTDITIKFSVKFLGFSNVINSSNTEFPFYNYGTKLKLLLKKITSSQYNLLLVYDTSASIISTYSNFEAFIGKWVNIVVSFSDYTSNVTYQNVYPNKINWQVNNKIMQITDANYSSLRISHFTTMTVPKEIIALWSKGIVTFNYFNGFMGIYSTKSKATGLKFDGLKRDTTTTDITDIYNGSSSTNCLSDTNFDKTNLAFNCVDDLDNLFDETKYTCDMLFYKDDGTCDTAKTSCPLGYFDNTTSGDNCSCSSADKKLMGIFKSNSKNVCKSNIYLY